VLIAAFALAACDQLAGGNSAKAPAPRRDPTALVTSPNTDVDEIASAEPGRDRRQWRAQGDITTRVTGSVTTSLREGRGGPLILAFANGITITGDRLAELRASTPSGVGQSFAELMAVNPNAKVYVYKVIDEQLSPAAARGGGLCQLDRTSHVAVSEFVDQSGDWVLRVAAFRGLTPPGEQTDPQLCHAFRYAPS
jgi:hypothetical protein